MNNSTLPIGMDGKTIEDKEYAKVSIKIKLFPEKSGLHIDAYLSREDMKRIVAIAMREDNAQKTLRNT